MTDPSRELELLALARLGLASRVGAPGDATGGDGGLLDGLVRNGRLARHQAEAVRSYVARHAVPCACGARVLAPEDAVSLSCRRCGAALVRPSASASTWTKRARVELGPGSRVGPLELLRALGKGASGTVFEARHAALGRLSAVKVIPAAALDPRRRKRFEREVEALARSAHPNVVRVHAAFEVEGCLCCEMDLVPGGTLEERVAREGPLPWREGAALVAKLSRAVAHAHAAGVLHRDLKPANVLLREGDREPLLVDFGLSRLSDSASSLTAAGAILGTPVYMAPEAFTGKATPATDVYGLGAILYEALAGRPPFQEPSLSALFWKVANGACPPLAPPGAPSDLERVRARAMAPEPEERHGSALELARDLERVLAGEPLPSPGALRALRRALRRPRVRLGLALALGLLSVAGVVAQRALEKRNGGPGAALSPGTVEGALACLSGDEPDAARRQTALATLLAARTSGALTLRDLDGAISRAPRPAELRHVRALVARQRGLPIRADDLAAVASASGAEADLEVLASHALGAGLEGQDAAAATFAAWRAHPDARAVALLHAVTLLARGDRSRRGEVVRALDAARPTGERHVLLRRLLADADSVAAALEKDDFVGGPLDGAALRRLARGTATLGREPGLAGATPVVLAPLEEALVRAWHRARVMDSVRSPRRAQLSDAFEATREDLPPRLLGMLELMRVGDTDAEIGSGRSPEWLDSVGRAIGDAEPLLAAIFHERAGGAAFALPLRNAGSARWATERYERALATLDAFASRTPSPEDGESYWIDVTRRRSLVGLAGANEYRAETATDPGERKARLLAALEKRRAAAALSASTQHLVNLRVKDARLAVNTAFEADELPGPDDPLLGHAPQRDAVRAEVLRRKGRPVEALRLVAKDPSADGTAARALALSDLGQADGARAALAELEALERSGASPVYEFFASRRVAAAFGGR